MLCGARAATAPVHPHGRGDNLIWDEVQVSLDGSPPRAWGQYRALNVARAGERFTPTGVGTIAARPTLTPQCAVHPHGRGDNWRLLMRVRIGIGSPPRAWGQCDVDDSLAAHTRFTPTGVGTMTIGRPACMARSVHPHGRGDNVLRSAQSTPCAGSPPRAWGQCGGYDHLQRLCRFTPTGVGTIMAITPCTGCRPVHPHGRGDNVRSRAQRIGAGGSPPRAWGQLKARRGICRVVRFTPTGVGTILIFLCVLNGASVHPHGRGDNAQRAAMTGS